KPSAPRVADKLWMIAQQWDFPAISVAIAERISDGSADLNTLAIAAERRDSLKSNASDILQRRLPTGGYGARISAALLGDQKAEASILEGKDDEARVGLLACARMLREQLNEKQVARFLKGNNNLLQLAAERYLESADTQDAGKLLRANRPEEVLVYGAR